MFSRIKTWLGLDYYTSPLDYFLGQLNRRDRRLSQSEQQEVDKHRALFTARDQPTAAPKKSTLWDAF